jgi:5-methylcytosine-specific restriction endonuclease McrA
MTYAEQLKDRRWNIKRTEILLRDNFQCQQTGCGLNGEGMEIHHLDYFPGLRAWEYPNDMLITLCHDHHKLEQDRQELERHLSTTLKMKGFLFKDLLALSSLVDTDMKFTDILLKTLRKFQHG